MINARAELRDQDDDLLATIRIDNDGTLQVDGMDPSLLDDIAVYDAEIDQETPPIDRTREPEKWLYMLQYTFSNPYRHMVFIPE